MAKPSKVQMEVLSKMADGWQLGRRDGVIDGRAWIQKGGCGYGGEIQSVSLGTVRAMEHHGYIVKDTYKYPTQTYRLNIDAAAMSTPNKGESK
jgi:hypothetical protein